ncbi:MAG: glycosyltransferase [Candidatus Shapirobacteria bacterium]|nr:glycosyltransferase [Candidatus Shapirobacteria bacterium]
MIQKKRILVLTDDRPWGHRSIAKAIFNYLKRNENENNFEVEYAEVKANTVGIDDLYVFAYRYMPKSTRVFHKFSGSKISSDVLREISILNLENLKSKIDEFNPDLIISTYFVHSHSLSWWRKKENKKFKLWSVVPDPWTINPISFIKGVDLNIVYDETSFKEGLRWGIDKDKMLKTNWWTRLEMYQKFDRQESRKKLGFKDDRPVIFIGGGSLGTNSLSRFLPIMLMVKKKVGFIINTGTDKLSFNLVEQFIKVMKRLKKDDLVQIKQLGWIENMGEVLSACDIVFGKAGPNFLFDVVAVRKPFVAITHIGGQEDGNIDLIKKKKIGWVKEKNFELLNFFLKYMENPKIYNERYLKNISRERELNKESLPLIMDRIKSEI